MLNIEWATVRGSAEKRKFMDLLVNKVISSILQIILFLFIPFVWWLITARKKQKFAEWIGLKKIEGGKKTFAAVVIASVAFMLLGAFMLYMISGIETAASEFAGLGATAIPAIVVYAAFNTAFPEELLFRGFILKRLSNKFHFNIANIVQALLFGLLHGAMFFPFAGAAKTFLIIVFTGTIAWFMGYINEKLSNGSIIPSWIIHTASNLFSGIASAFLLL